MSARRPALIWLLLLGALALRAGWVVQRWHAQGATLAYPDEELHWQLARNLVHSGTLATDDGRYAARMPLYPLFLALFAGLGPTGVLVAKLAQAALGAATAGAAFGFARRALGPRAALVAGVLVACDPFGVFFANLLLSETVFTLLLVAFIWCAWGTCVSGTRRAAIGVALLGPALILTRPSAVALVPLVWLASAWAARPRAVGRTAGSLVLNLLVVVLMLLPWGLRNRAVLGSSAWLSTNGGVTLYDAQGPQADGSSNQTFLRELPELQDRDEAELDDTLTRLAWQQMQAEPGRVLRLAGTKFLRLWNPFPNVAEYRGGAAAWAGAAYTLVVLLVAIAAAVRVLTRHSIGADRRRFQLFLWLPILYFTLLHCIYIGSVRYRVPLMPLLCLGAAAVATSPAPRNVAHD